MRPRIGTAFGLAVNLPRYRYNDTYQFQNNLATCAPIT